MLSRLVSVAVCLTPSHRPSSTCTPLGAAVTAPAFWFARRSGERLNTGGFDLRSRSQNGSLRSHADVASVQSENPTITSRSAYTERCASTLTSAPLCSSVLPLTATRLNRGGPARVTMLRDRKSVV